MRILALSILLFCFLIAFVSARVIEIPMNEITEIVAMTTSIVRVIPDGTEPYDFQTGECVYVMPMFDYADYTILNNLQCITSIIDPQPSEAHIDWLIYDYICDGCTQWTSRLLEADTFGIVINEVSGGDGTEESGEPEPGEG